ncbi:MAG TPA: DnaJ C-terminal domain-containing protein [Anaerolineales bacterium]|nr:DnaJ C-terminal domain-containing protein [Anaerolineales bacterium]
MDFKDYYEILGVPPNAEKKIIRQTYRQLAKKYHPDVNPGNNEAETKFKTINEAYQVLSDVEQRKKYDELRAQYQQWQQTGGRQHDFDWQNWSAQPGEGARVQYASPEDLEDLFGSESPYSDFFTSIFGQARRSGRGSVRGAPPSPHSGRDIEYEVDLTLTEAFHGADRLLQIDGHRIQASIPPGVRTGLRVRLAGQGEPGRNSGPAGDLYLIVNILPNDTFEREGDDLHIDVPVDMFTAVAGGETRIPTLERPLILKIPPRTNAGRSFRLRGKGMPHLGDPKTRGDLFALVKLVLPDPLTDQEVNSIRELASTRQKHA